MDHQMEFRVLGPLEILADGKPVKLDAPKQRALLAVLLIHANEVVSTDRLLELVWEEEQPSGGLRTLRFHISKLRDALEPGRAQGEEGVIATRSPGYALDAAPAGIDALHFETLLAEARQARATDPAAAIALLDEALALWRGDPYADFAYDEFAHAEILSLTELRLRAMEERFDLLISAGRERDVLTDLQRLVDEHPRREQLTATLMLALYRSGRQADALAAYQALRGELGEELGIEPSQELQDLEEKILLHDETLAADTPAPAAEFLRGYVLRGRIGEGAHGVVWRAGQPGVGREVAIKAIRPDIANRPGFVRRFEMEAQLVASLEHPHIVSLFDFWRDPEGAYLVMPYLRGGDVAALLQQGPLRPDSALELIQAIGGALGYAHRRGVIHRDVTPHNVLLDDEGHPYVADFGIATLIGESGPPTSSSPAYMSPEQHAGEMASPQSDVFSVGVLAHSVLTGELPILGEDLRPVSSFRSDLPATVDEVVELATAIDTTERYRDIEALVADLSRSLGASAPVEAHPVIETRNPYKGLRAFGETDAGDFFGRDQLESELVESVSRNRLVGVVGPSGCGKSSLVRAGLIPLLRRGALPGSERWLITDMYPGSQPFSELHAALLRVAVDMPAHFADRLAGDSADRRGLVAELLPRDSELLLIVDQFEELFTLTVDEDGRRRFLEALADLVGDPLNRVRVVVTLRADFYDRPLEYAEFGDLLRSGLVSVTMPTTDSLTKAVKGPAQRVGLEVEPGLAERVVNDVGGQPGGLPLLEYALTELFQRRDESRLTLDGYERTGGVLGALGRRAESISDGYNEAGQQAVRQVFLRLVTVEEGAADTRRRIPLAELQGIDIEASVLERVLNDYGSHRLLTFDRDPDTRAPTVEVAHEALLARWDRLRTWIDDRRDGLLLHRRLAASVAEWRDAGKQSEYLLTGGRLEHYEAFAEETDIALSGEEREYLDSSREQSDRIASRRRRIRNAVMGGFAAAAMIALVLAVFAFASQRQAEDATADAQESERIALANEQEALDQKDRADVEARLKEEEASRADEAREEAFTEARVRRVAELSAQSRLANETDPELGILLALEAVAVEIDGAPLVEAVDTLHAAVMASRLRLTVPGFWTGNVDAGSALLVALPSDGPVTIYDVASGASVLSLSLSGDLLAGETVEFSAAISPDGDYVATGRSDGTVALWDADSGEELFSTNDQQRLWTDATSGEFTLSYLDQTTEPIEWDADATEIEFALESLLDIVDVVVVGVGTEQEPWRVEFVDAQGPHTARLVPDGVALEPAEAVVHIRGRGHDYEGGDLPEGVYDVEFSPDGAVLASRAWDDTIRIWDVASGDERFTLEAPVSSLNVRGVSFSPDGSLLVNAFDENAWVWEVSTGELVHDLFTETEAAKDAAFLPSGSEVVIAHDAEEDRALTIWNLDTGEERSLPGKGSSLRSVAVSSDGGTIITGDWIGNVYVKALSEDGIRDLYDFRAHQIEVFDLMLSKDDLLVSTAEGETRVWDLSVQGNSEYLAIPSASWLTTVGYSPDGSSLALPGPDGPIVTVDSLSGENLLELGIGPDASRYQVSLLRFSPNGRYLAAGIHRDFVWNSPLDSVVYLWDTQTGILEQEVEVGDAAFWDLAFSRDGSLLAGVLQEAAGGAWKRQVRLWEVASFEEVLTIDGADEGWEPQGVAFSSDGTELAIRGWNPDESTDFVAIYDLLGQRLRICCEHHAEVLASVAYSPDGSVLLTSGFDFDTAEGTVKLWDTATGAEVGVLQGHQRAAHGAIFNSDGSLIASNSYGEIRIWDVASKKGLMTLLADGEDPIYGLSFSPDSSRIASTGDSGLVRVWALDVDELVDLAQSRLHRTFTAAECEIYEIVPCPAEE